MNIKIIILVIIFIFLFPPLTYAFETSASQSWHYIVSNDRKTLAHPTNYMVF